MGSPIKFGTVNVSARLTVIDATTGIPDQSLTFTDFALWYRREVLPGNTPLAVQNGFTEVSVAATGVHANYGIVHLEEGVYRVDMPDVAFAAGAIGVTVGAVITGKIIIADYIPLVAYDPYDTVRMGLTALPDAVAKAAGGLIVSTLGSTDADDCLTVTGHATSVALATVDSNVDAILLDTADLQSNQGNWLTGNTVVPPTVAQFNARTLVAADYFDPATDPVANVTLTATCTNNTDMRGTEGANTVTPDAAGVVPTAIEIRSEIDLNSTQLAAIAGYIDIEIGTLITAVNAVQTDLSNGTDGLGALKALLDTLDTVADAIKVKTDQMVFTKANELDVNARSNNGGEITGNGDTIPWDGL